MVQLRPHARKVDSWVNHLPAKFKMRRWTRNLFATRSWIPPMVLLGSLLVFGLWFVYWSSPRRGYNPPTSDIILATATVAAEVFGFASLGVIESWHYLRDEEQRSRSQPWFQVGGYTSKPSSEAGRIGIKVRNGGRTVAAHCRARLTMHKTITDEEPLIEDFPVSWEHALPADRGTIDIPPAGFETLRLATLHSGASGPYWAIEPAVEGVRPGFLHVKEADSNGAFYGILTMSADNVQAVTCGIQFTYDKSTRKGAFACKQTCRRHQEAIDALVNDLMSRGNGSSIEVTDVIPIEDRMNYV